MKSLQFVICFVFLSSVIAAAPRNFESSSSPATSSFVMIGNSKESYKKLADSEVKNHRSSYSQHYPSMMHEKPSSDYYHHGFPTPSFNSPPAALISANVNLLEPFMLVTFLLFVLSLVDKARFPPPSYFARTDFIQELPVNFTEHQQRFLKTINDPENF